MKYNYKVIPDFFNDIPDNERSDAEQFLPRFGLIESHSARWRNLKTRIKSMNELGRESSTTYRVLFIGRHGEGYHNRAMDLYGHQKWAEKERHVNPNEWSLRYWAELTTDGTITWGPDPLLTNVGINQAYKVNQLWKEELAYDIPVPESFYCSPLTRAITTALISFEGIALAARNDKVEDPGPKAIIKENLRERKYGLHTCNNRRSRTFIKETYPQLTIEDGFTEDDPMWSTDHTETDHELRSRVRHALDEIFENDNSTYISITAHAHTNKAIREVFGASWRRMPTGGLFTMVVEVSPYTSESG